MDCTGRKAVEKRASELQEFIDCNELVKQHCRVAAYDSRLNAHKKYYTPSCAHQNCR